MQQKTTGFDYIATFPAGCFDVIARRLKQFTVDELKITDHDDSSVTFKTSLTAEHLIELRFFTNVYLLIDDLSLEQVRPFVRGSKYRLIGLRAGEPVAIPEARRFEILNKLSEVVSKVDKSDERSTDFVLMRRQNDKEHLTLRLPRAKHKRQDLPPGALRPELAHILLLIAGVKAKDTVLDPFAGSGSIAREATQGFGVKNMTSLDKDAEAVRLMQQAGLTAKVGDAATCQDIALASIDRVVTDPPWGIFEDRGAEALTSLYESFIQKMQQLLKKDGVLVILTAADEAGEIIRHAAGFELLKQYAVLVSGKKANIYKLQKS